MKIYLKRKYLNLYRIKSLFNENIYVHMLEFKRRGENVFFTLKENVCHFWRIFLTLIKGSVNQAVEINI